MSHTIHKGQELVVGTYAGPLAGAGESRRRWQFTCREPNGIAVLTDAGVEELLAAMLRHHGNRARIASIPRAAVSP